MQKLRKIKSEQKDWITLLFVHSLFLYKPYISIISKYPIAQHPHQLLGIHFQLPAKP